jgi:hypothetical protein
VTLEKPWLRTVLLCGGLLCATVPAHAQILDFLFGKKPAGAESAQPDANQRSWRMGEFTQVQLVPRETGGADNQHPAQWPAETLRQQLAQVRTEFRGEPQPLFGADELSVLVGALSQALALAKPGDDLLLLSTHRRGGGILIAPFGITARLFVQDGSLQLIVHDARLDFMDTYIGTRVQPTFTYGSRVKAGRSAIQSAAAVSRRADWLSIPGAAGAAASLNVAPAAAVATPVTPAAAPAPAAAASAVPARPSVAAAAPAASAPPAAAARPAAGAQAQPGGVPTPKPRDPGFAEEIEQRLITLKRLLDRQLISEEEYKQMRKEVLQLL